MMLLISNKCKGYGLAMSAAWTGSVTPIGPPESAVPRLRDLIYAAVVTGSWAGLISAILYVFARLIGVPFVAAPPGQPAQLIPWFLMFLAPLIAALAFGLLSYFVLGRRHAQRIAFWAGTAAAAVSLVSPLVQPADVLWSTRIWLSVFQVVAWILIVPQIARIVGDSEPGRFVLDEQNEASSS